MDIACVILGIISLCRSSMPLSIVTTCVGVVELVLLASVSSHKKAEKKEQKQQEKLDESLEKAKQKTSDSLYVSAALFAIIVGVTKICIM